MKCGPTIARALIGVTAYAIVFGSYSTFAQSSDETDRAKKHYESAAAAIAKNDWEAAKSELIEAERLAPNNALIHYDLALAFSHTGMTSTALKQLKVALNLGLPQVQNNAAKKLTDQLQQTPYDANVVAENHKAAAEPARPRIEQGPSIEETLRYLNNDLQNKFSLARGDSGRGPVTSGFVYDPSNGTLFWGKRWCENCLARNKEHTEYILLKLRTTSDIDSDLNIHCVNGSDCVRRWIQHVPRTAEETRDFLAGLTAPPSDARERGDFGSEEKIYSGNADPEDIKRFARAFTHFLGLAKPKEDEKFSAPDPFAE